MEYDTWDAAFKALVPQVRQQSVRVAAYARELYVQACSMPFGKQTQEGRDRMYGRYADTVYKCGMYHQLGKALVPPEYQLRQPDFKEEEEQLFRKYTTDGRLLVANLQMQTARSRFWKKDGYTEEQPTDNIPWLMIRESCQQHMERWDGSGYPDGRKGHEISPVAQIVGLAKELDALASGTRSESPFDEAVEQLCAQAGTMWSPELIAVLNASIEQCRSVYLKYIHYTLTIPKTIPLVERAPDRNMGLSYRPIHGAPNNEILGYEATPWFSGILDRPGEVERIADVASMLRNIGLVKDVTFYFLYEAADTLLRLRNCRVGEKKLLLQVPDEIYDQNSYLKDFAQLFEDQPIDKASLMLTISESALKNAGKGVQENITRYLRNDIELVLDNFHPDSWEPETLKAFGFRRLRLAPELCEQPELADTVPMLKTWGFSVMASGAENVRVKKQLFAAGVEAVCGPCTGAQMPEDDMIRDAIVRAQK